jgi:NitT/TauT family transport system permease protein
MSNNQKIYLKKIKKQTLIIRLIQIIIVLQFIFVWQFLSDKQFINTFLFSSPKLIMETLVTLFKNNDLFPHIFTTLYEVLISFSIGTILGLFISILLYEFKTLAKIIDPFLTMINSLPKVALGPLIIIIFGANNKSIIVMALLINLIVSIMTIYNGFLNIDPIKTLLFRSFKSSKITTLFRLIIPSSKKTIIASCKLNISMSLIGVIMGEFLVSKKGIGYLIINGTQIFNLSLVMTGIFLLVILSFLLYETIILIEKKSK